ncbi:MAG TPA: hypothetical protein PKW75_00215 [candidate division Zixibacteria bacterium]|nr:hypothetical protein [candidate division Zixibacteria bacterium]HPM38663.1 hypothetical protein [candidate division Zixibacteria bacterium]
MTDTPVASIIANFLRTPLSRRAFDAFFDLSCRRTIVFLRNLRARHVPLPLAGYAGDDPMRDLAIDVLAGILAPAGGLPCPGLFPYLKRQGCPALPPEDITGLESLFGIFLYCQVKQQISRLWGEHDPQVALLKRRVRDILASSEYVSWTDPSTRAVLVAPAQDAPHPRPDAFVVEPDMLRRTVLAAFNRTTNRSSWCAAIFRLIRDETGAPPVVPLYELLALMVEVNAAFLAGAECAPAPLPGPEELCTRAAGDRARQRAVDDTAASAIARYVTLGRITPAEGEAFRKALELYLADFLAGGSDGLPAYFREVMPPEAHERYLQDYKYVFETTLNEGYRRMIDLLGQSDIGLLQ